MKPFADNEASTSIGELTIENGTAAVSVYGSLRITRDEAGLKQAKRLKAVIDAAVDVLEAIPDLPKEVQEQVEHTVEVDNPFA